MLLIAIVAPFWMVQANRSRAYVAAKPTGTMKITDSGAGPVRIGMSRKDLDAAIGMPDAEDEGTLKYFGMGLEVFVSRNAVKQVILHARTPDEERRGFNNFERFEGTTDRGISVGAERNDVISAYGQPKEVLKIESEEALVYHHPNLTFMINQNGRIRTIVIRLA